MFEGKIPKEILDCVKSLENKGFEAFLVGGCVRDLILNREPKDWDLTTNAKPGELIDIFPEHVYENNFGTVGVKTDSEDPKLKIVEITPYRLESAYSDNRHPDSVQFSNKLEDDLQRRDFTINSLAFDINKGQIIDLYKGQEDIKDKIIRTVGDPNERFDEDALRMLRAIRFSAELGFTINIDTLNSLVSKENLMKNVSCERIRDEFTKIIMSENPMLGIVMAQKTGLLKYVSPVFEEMLHVEQNKEAHKYDVWEHSLRTLQHAADKNFGLEVRLAALFHDIAKPSTKRISGEKTTFYGHEVVGAKVTHETLKKLNYSKETIENVTKLVRWHMFFSDTEEITPAAVRRLIKRVGKEHIWDLMNLRKCDRIGSGRPKEQPYRFRKFQSMIDEVMRDPISVGMLSLNGDIMIGELHMKPGPKIGYVLHALLEEVLEDPTKNDLAYQKEKALELYELDIEELKKLGEQGVESKIAAEEKEVTKIRSKRHVK